MSRKTACGSTAGWLCKGVIKTEDLGRRRVFMKKEAGQTAHRGGGNRRSRLAAG